MISAHVRPAFQAAGDGATSCRSRRLERTAKGEPATRTPRVYRHESGFPRIRAFPHGNKVSKDESHGWIDQVADRGALAETGSTKKNAALFLEGSRLAYKQAKNTFTFPGVGKLVLVNRKARMGRNPATGEAIKIPAKRVVKFRVAKAAKDAILGAKK